MNSCEKIRMQLGMLLYGELSFDEEETVDAHLEGCAECRAALERERALHAAFDQAEIAAARVGAMGRAAEPSAADRGGTRSAASRAAGGTSSWTR